MTVLSLNSDFFPFNTVNEEMLYDDFIFSGGEVHIKLKSHSEDVFIAARLNTSNDIMKLILAVDALQRHGTHKLKAFIPYLPYARQDRVMVPGEPLSVKVMCTLINNCKFDHLYIYDVHSEVSLALLNNCTPVTNHALVETILRDKTNYYLVSPDAGALKKIYNLAKAIQYTADIILCNKIRDVSNGNIKKITVDKEDLEGKDCYIIDDICDGGATFIGVAKELKTRKAAKVYLVVSHGLFSHGEEELAKWLDGIYTTDSITSASSTFIQRTKLSTLIKF